VVLRLRDPPDETLRRLRPEKSREVARGRGFDSRHLHHVLAYLTAALRETAASQ
jgi:hypothetical protein